VRGLAAISLLVVLVAGCGSQSGLHVENGGHTVVVVPAGSSGGGHTTTPALPQRVTARIRLGGVPAIAWDGATTMWAAFAALDWVRVLTPPYTGTERMGVNWPMRLSSEST